MNLFALNYCIIKINVVISWRCVEATNKKLLENHHSASLPPQSLVVFAFKKYMKKRYIISIEFKTEQAALLALLNESVKKELISSKIYYLKNNLNMDLEFKSNFGIYIFGEVVGRIS